MKSWWVVAFGIILGLLIAGIIWLVSTPPRGNPIKLLPPPTPIPIKIHITGEVRNPGVYALPLDSRVQDAIKIAGGFTALADKTALNLAAPLEDGSRVQIPIQKDFIDSDFNGTTATPNERLNSIPTAQPGSTPITNKIININTADQVTLELLSGIGPVIAESIITYRVENGLFKSIEEIQKVPGIGPVKFEKIKDIITIDDLP